MSYKPIAALEAKIEAGSHEDTVDDLWVNIAPMYFTLLDGFTMTAQSRIRVDSGQKIDVGVRKFINGNVRVVVFEDASYEHQGQASQWAAKRGQLKRYLGQTRVEEYMFKKTLYGVITIGKASQFFSYPYGQSELQCLHDDSEAYNFKDQQAEVDYWMTYLRDEVKAGR